MKVKILSGHNKIGEIVEAKRYCELNEEELEESLGGYGWENVNGIFIQHKSNEWIYMLNEEVEIVEE